MTASDVLLQLDGVSMQYGRGETAITALAGVDLSVRRLSHASWPRCSGAASASCFRIST
jgi:putative ABC transport system ATP-binding protein